MKKVMKKFNRALSIMLVAAMVLTMAPQTAMPVLAEEATVDETVTPDVPAENDEAVVEETVEAPENGENDEIAVPSDEENVDTEGDDISNETPVEEEPVEEEPSDEEIADPSTDEEEEDLTDTANSVEIMENNTPLTVPTITVTRGADENVQELKSGAKVPFGTDDIKFTLSEADEGAELYYLVGEGDPYSKVEDLCKDSNAKKYTAGEAVSVTAPTAKKETAYSIQAIQMIPGKEAEGENPATEDQFSAIAAFRIIFEAKVNKITVADLTDVEVKVGTVATAVSTVLGKDGYALDSNKNLYLTAAVTGKEAATKEVDKVLYATQEKVVTSGFVWFAEEGKLTEGVTEVTLSNGKYMIPKDALGEDLVLNVTRKTMPKIAFTLPEGTTSEMFTVTATKATKPIPDWTNRKLNGDEAIYAPTGSSNIVVTITPNASCELTAVKYKSNAADAKEKDGTKSGATYKVSLGTAADPFNADYTITVTATESYKGAIIKDGEKILTEDKAKTWTVDPRKTYTISAEQGGGSVYKIGDAKIVPAVDGAEIKPVKKSGSSESGEETTNTGEWELTLNAEADGKQPVNGQPVKVELYDKEGEGQTKVDTITINVRPVITKVTVTGANGNVISQIIGTNKTYPIKLETREATSTDELRAESSDTAQTYIETAKIEEDANGKPVLKVVTKAAAVQDNAATIKIYNDSDKTEGKKPVGTVDVNTIAPTWTAKTPTVKLASASDIALKLNMTLPQGMNVLAKDAETKYVYKVTTKYISGSVSANDLFKNGKIKKEETTYVEASDSNTTTSDEIKVIEQQFGQGTDAKFDVEVVLELYTKEATAGTDISLVSSKPALLRGAATKAPYYADKITLKKAKAASGIYTGQTETVATIDFGKNTTYNRDNDVKVEVVGQKETTGENIIKADIDDSTVKLTVGKNVEPGKYNIRVTQTVQGDNGTEEGYGIPATAKPTSATLQVTVVQGIKSIALTAQPDIYVSGKAAGTAKIAVTYNNNETKPKTAKVTYELAAVDKDDKIISDADEVAKVKNYVAVKDNNGTVTVKKDYTDGNITSNKFAVRAKAADFSTNSTESDYKVFTITNTAKTLGDIVIVTKTDNTFTQLKADDKGIFTIKADQLASTYVRVLKYTKGVDEKTNYAEADFEDAANYSLTLSNKKDVNVKDDFSLNATKVVNNVTVNAVANDGGKQKAPNSGKVKFSIAYADVTHDNAKLEIKVGTDANGAFEEFKDGVFAANGKSAKQVYTVKASDTGNKIGKCLVDYKITAGKGAKIVKARFPEAQVMMTADVATLNLVGPKGTTAKVYTIKNDVLAASNKTTAPKITLAKGEKIYANYAASRKVTFTVAKGIVADANKIVITADQDQGSQDLYSKLNTKVIMLGTGDEKVELSTDKTTDIELEFAEKVPVVKSATLYFDFVKVEPETETEDENANESGSTTETVLTKAPASVKVKTEVLKKSYKLNTKYTMSAKDLAKVSLTPSGKTDGNPQVAFTRLLNANIGGKINKFTGNDSDGNKNAFEFDTQKKMLVLANPAKAINDKKTKENNLTGFVEYTVTYEDGTKDENMIVQITVTMKDKPVQSLKATKATVLEEENISTTITVMAGKSAVELAVAEYVANDASKGGDAKIKSTDVKSGDTKGEVTLSYGGTPKFGTYKGTLYVVPADSYYADKAAAAYTASKTPVASQADENEMTWAAYKEKGIAIAVPVDFVVKKVDDRGKKISIDSKNLKLNYQTREDVIIAKEKDYTLTVPFTFATQATLDTESPVTIVANPKNPDWVSVQKVSGENKIAVTIDKELYAVAVKKSLTNNKYPANGTLVSVTVQFNFKESTAVADTFKLDITPMKLSDSEIADAKVPVAEQVTITAPAANVAIKKGTETTLTATVTGKNILTEKQAAVEWSIKEQNTDEGTKIEGNKLIIAKEEALDKITIIASSKVMGGDGNPVTAELEITLESAEEETTE